MEKTEGNDTPHNQLVKLIKNKLKADGERIYSPKTWIRGPTIPDIVSYSEPSNASHPILRVIEVKGNDKKDLQRALYQLMAARESILKSPPKDMYVLFSVAISQHLYDELIRTNELDLFLNVWSGPLTEMIMMNESGRHIKQEKTSLGFGVILVNEKNEIEYLVDPHPYKI